MNNITREELLNPHVNNLTVGDIKKFIEEHNIPDDAIIVVQRIGDNYFDGVDISGFCGCQDTKDGIFPKGSKTDGWGVYLKRGDNWWSMQRHNEKIDSGYYLNKENFPDIKGDEEFLKKFTEEEMEEAKDQYFSLFTCVNYQDEPDKKIIFLDAHY